MSIFNETYKTCCINLDDVSEEDQHCLWQEMTHNPHPSVAHRPDGYFIKVFEGMTTLKPFSDFSDKFKLIIKCALEEDFKCIEIDCDALEVGGK